MSGTDATRCKVCGGEFGEKRVLIDGMAYHPRCSVMSYPSHTYEDYQRLSVQLSDALAAFEDIKSLCAGSDNDMLDFIGKVAEAVLEDTPRPVCPVGPSHD